MPFQFSRHVRDRLKGGSFVQSSQGVKVTDLDRNEFYDLTGSYGVNVFGYDFYKANVSKLALNRYVRWGRYWVPTILWLHTMSND